MSDLVEQGLADKGEVDKWDKWTRNKLTVSAAALFISAAWLVLCFSGLAVPLGSDPGDWFQRSGAAVTVFAVYNQQWLASIPKSLLPSPGAWADMSKVEVWRRYMHDVPTHERINLALMLTATLVWGYGDIVRSYAMRLIAS